MLYEVITGKSKYTGDVTDVVTIDRLPENGIYSKIWQPYIAQWQKNYYVVTYSLQLAGKGDMGDMLCSISKDGGKTWSPSRITSYNVCYTKLLRFSGGG